MQFNADRFWSGKRVFLTGHTGFKGSWLCLWLQSLGASVTGYALKPPTDPSLFALCGMDAIVSSVVADIRDYDKLAASVAEAGPEIVIHMAAQPLVRRSYEAPAETYEVNVMGTVNLFEAVKTCKTVKAVINVTSDKCYENREWVWGYRESDPLGGYDPYSSSKACSELVTQAYRSSFFNFGMLGLASARSGNVIGGGDWAQDRLVPDCVRALLKGEKIVIRNPASLRPWQHVLEPLAGYLMLGQRLCEDGPRYSRAWNFGPDDRDVKPVEWLVGRMCDRWGKNAGFIRDGEDHPHEARYLKLDCSMAGTELGWHPRWNLDKAIDSVIEWTAAYEQGGDMKDVCLKQIADYMKTEGAE